jgi:hypothetical protein
MLLLAALPLGDGVPWRPTPRAVPAAATAAVGERFQRAADFRGFVERHREALDDPETAYYVSQALEECALTRPAAGERPRGDTAEHWAQLAAADALVAPCRGFDGRAIDPNEIVTLLARAAARGEPRATARMLLFRDIAAPKSDLLPKLQRLLATRDPGVVRDVGAFLSRGESAWWYGDREFPVAAAAIAWELAACDLGYACGPGSRIVLLQCAFDSRCEGGRYEDGLARHEPADLMADAQRLRGGILRALREYDWTWLGLAT